LSDHVGGLVWQQRDAGEAGCKPPCHFKPHLRVRAGRYSERFTPPKRSHPMQRLEAATVSLPRPVSRFADWHPRLSRRRPGLCADRSRPSAMRSYAATLANELTHSTKHSARLARDLGRIQRRIGPPLSVARPGRAAPRPGDAGRATAGAVRLARRSSTRRRARRRGLSRAEPVQRAGA
jgi:hypothetical protein